MKNESSRSQNLPPFDPWTDDVGSVDDPSAIIATIPGTLGYYPQDSIVVIGLIPDPANGRELILGPVLRADLAHAGQLANFLETAPVERCVAFLGVLVTRTPDAASARIAINDLDSLVRDDGEPLVDVLWHVSEIAQGTPYTMLFGPDPALMAREWPHVNWGHGVVGSVINSPAMRAMRDNGTLPALNRKDTFEYFEHDSVADSGIDVIVDGEIVDIASLTRDAARRADVLRGQLDQGIPTPGWFVRRAMTALRDAPPQPLVGVDGRCSLGHAFQEVEALNALATVLSRSLFRDCVIGTAVRYPEQSATALLAIARSFKGVIRANALSLWAIVAISRGLSSWASAALVTAQEEMPQHSMSAICLEILAAGQQQHLVTTILQGCELACEHIIGTDEERDDDLGFDQAASA